MWQRRRGSDHLQPRTVGSNSNVDVSRTLDCQMVLAGWLSGSALQRLWIRTGNAFGKGTATSSTTDCTITCMPRDKHGNLMMPCMLGCACRAMPGLAQMCPGGNEVQQHRTELVRVAGLRARHQRLPKATQSEVMMIICSKAVGRRRSLAAASKLVSRNSHEQLPLLGATFASQPGHETSVSTVLKRPQLYLHMLNNTTAATM